MAKKKAYIVMTHSYSPNPDTTCQEDAWLVTENCEFINSLKNRHYTKASVILDYIKKDIIKNRVDEVTYSQYIDYVSEKYKDQYSDFENMFPKTEKDELKDLQEGYAEMFSGE